MKLKLIIKKENRSKRVQLFLWVQYAKELRNDLDQIIQFFHKDIKITKKRRFHEYYKITSDNPAIIISLMSTLQEIIPEVYFSAENPLIAK